MPRGLQRLCLQDGISIDLNRLIRRGQLTRDGLTTGAWIGWTSSYWGHIGAGIMTADMRGEYGGDFTIRMNEGHVQHIALVAHPRHFGGRQWYFLCPSTGRLASVLWRLNGASKFYSRFAYGPRQVGYRSQFLDRDSRAHHGQAKIKRHLCEIGQFDPDEWDLPPKPKWMRQRTYERIEAAYDHYDETLNNGLADAVARLMAAGGL